MECLDSLDHLDDLVASQTNINDGSFHKYRLSLVTRDLHAHRHTHSFNYGDLPGISGRQEAVTGHSDKLIWSGRERMEAGSIDRKTAAVRSNIVVEQHHLLKIREINQQQILKCVDHKMHN